MAGGGGIAGTGGTAGTGTAGNAGGTIGSGTGDAGGMAGGGTAGAGGMAGGGTAGAGGMAGGGTASGSGGSPVSDAGAGAITCESSPGALIDIGTLPGDFGSAAVAIDDRGDVLANSAACAGCTPSRGFFWQAGAATPLTAATGIVQAIAMDHNGRAIGEGGVSCANITACLDAWNVPSPAPIPFGVPSAIDTVSLTGVGNNDAPFASARVQRGCSTCFDGVIWQSTLGNTVTDLGTIDGVSTTGSTASAMNSIGQVVGMSGGRAVLWAPAIHDLGNLGAGGASAVAINDLTEVAGTSRTAGGMAHAFLWQSGLMQDLGTLQGGSSQAVAINAAGDVVGNSDGHAFVWRNGAMSDLGTLGGTSSTAVAINDAGMVTGSSQTAAGKTHPFLWQGGVMIDLGTLGGPSGNATAINVAGLVIGTSTTASGDSHAFLACPSLSSGGSGGTGG